MLDSKNINSIYAKELLHMAGFDVPAKEIRVADRGDRWWIAYLPENRLAWFGSTPNGTATLTFERRVLALVGRYCTFRVPKVLYIDPQGQFDIREMVPGSVDYMEAFKAVSRDTTLAKSLGRQIGILLAQQHTLIPYSEAAEWIELKPSWPGSREWILKQLPLVVDDPKLITDADQLLTSYDAIKTPPSEGVLVHTDVGFHNMGIDRESYNLNGFFDYGEAAWADHHHDFRYLIYDTGKYDLLDAAVVEYQARGGRAVRRDRVLMYNAVCALAFLAFRKGTRPEKFSCGRDLAGDLRWSRDSLKLAFAAM
jgi:aminoglycoside phosphotransferase